MGQYVRNKARLGSALALTPTASLSSSIKKFGAASLQRSGNGQWLIPAAVRFGTGDFCIEGWGRWDSSNTSNAALFFLTNTSGNVGFEVYRRPASGNVMAVYDLFTNRIIGTTPVAVDTLVHVALYRLSGMTYLAVEGQLQGNWDNPTDLGDLSVGIGGYNASLSSETMSGFLDEVRLTIGASRYGASNFASPTAAFATNSADDPDWEKTLVLYSFDVPDAVNVASRGTPFRINHDSFPLTVDVQSRPDRFGIGNTWWGGRGRIRGSTKVKGAPSRPDPSRVLLIQEGLWEVVDEVWSNPATGEYIFDSVDMSKRYTALAYDETHNFRAVVADNMTPEPMP